MSETRWTKGPWGFGNTSDDQRIILGDNGSGRYVCNVQIHQTPRRFGLLDESEREANATLILAAPALYDLLDEAINYLLAWAATQHDEEASALLNKSTAALAAARGEQP